LENPRIQLNFLRGIGSHRRNMCSFRIRSADK
jgi:hypothetical protein